jgi:hypothetical protein
MADRVEITISIPRETWETLQRFTRELQVRAREQGMVEASFDPLVHAGMLLEQAVDMELEREKRH